MVVTNLDQTWAQSQVEAMADGSLSPDAERRMRAAMERDPRLAASVSAAVEIRQQLRGLANVAVPRGLWWRLWRIPSADRKFSGMSWLPAGAVAALAVAAIGANLFLQSPEPVLDDAAQAAAVQDFAIVVAYLQKSAVMARNEVNDAVGSGVLSALAASRGMLDRTNEFDVSKGEQDNDD